MSALTVTAERNITPTTTPSVHLTTIGQRVRRAVSISGVTALLIGATLGIVQADPHLLASLVSRVPPPLSVTLVGAGIMGLVSGLIAGLALRGKMGLLRWMVAMFALMVGLIGAEMVYGLVMRVPLGAALRAVNDGIEAAQIGIGALMALAGSLAGRQSQRGMITTNARPAVAVAAAAPAPAPARSSTPRRSRSTSTRSSGTSSTPRRTSSRSKPSRIESPAPPPLVVKPKSRKRGWFKRRQVNLGKQTTNVCPYCLEEVLTNDPRGKVVCEICGTPHHGDCWSIAGKCEVPHLQT